MDEIQTAPPQNEEANEEALREQLDAASTMVNEIFFDAGKAVVRDGSTERLVAPGGESIVRNNQENTYAFTTPDTSEGAAAGATITRSWELHDTSLTITRKTDEEVDGEPATTNDEQSIKDLHTDIFNAYRYPELKAWLEDNKNPKRPPISTRLKAAVGRMLDDM